MTLVLASLMVRPGCQAAFESAFGKAERLLAGSQGYLAHELRRSVECDQHYALLIEWRSLEDDTLGFRKSAEFLRWQELLQRYFSSPPRIEHFHAVAPSARTSL
jgi:heme-degrading monooxygenase HmoA